jgi:excisionase family DNA binding protein
VAHLLDIPATAEKLATTQRHVRELVYRKELPYFKVGRLVRFDSDELDAWLQANRVAQRKAA